MGEGVKCTTFIYISLQLKDATLAGWMKKNKIQYNLGHAVSSLNLLDHAADEEAHLAKNDIAAHVLVLDGLLKKRLEIRER